MYDIIVVGGGAAALAATLYALDKQLTVITIFEDAGGKAGTQQHLQNVALNSDNASIATIQLFRERVAAFPNALLHDRVIGLSRADGLFHVETQRHDTLHARTVIMATGATPLQLDAPGAKDFIQHGLGYSMTTHARLAAGKDVVVVGDTPRAFQGTAELARTAKQVTLLVRKEMYLRSGIARAVQRLPNVQLFAGYTVAALEGDKSVERVKIERDGEASWLKADLVFADLGLLPNSLLVRRMAQLDEMGRIIVDETNATTQPGLFAAGDVTTAHVEHSVIALGDGTRAAATAYEYLLCHPEAFSAEPAD